MNTNDPGREPEPTDAELAAVLDLFDAVKEWGSEEISSGDMMTEAEHRLAKAFRCISPATIARLRVAELSGARPMPDTPAPDEVAQLRAEVARLKYWKESAIANSFPPLHKIGKALRVPLGESIPDKILPGIEALEARIADLERENAALVEKLGALEKWSAVVEDHESFPEGVRAFSRGYESARRWVAMWFNPVVSAGKEAPDAGK